MYVMHVEVFHAAPEPQWTQTTNKAKRRKKNNADEQTDSMRWEQSERGAWNKFPARRSAGGEITD